jgi:cell division septal protein FtsQ
MKSSNLEYKKFQRTHGQKVKLLFMFSVLCLLAGVFYGLIKSEDFLKMKRVEVLGAKTYVNKNDVETLVKGSIYGKNFFSVDTIKIENDLKNNFLGASTVDVTKKIDGEVFISITERKPIAILIQKDNTFVVDDQGYVLGYMDPTTTNLPKILYEGDVRVGHFIDKSLVPVYADIIKRLDEDKIKVSSISMNEFDVRMYIEQGTEVIVSRRTYDGSFSARLKQVLSYLKSTGKSARSIDLRYDKVILSFN